MHIPLPLLLVVCQFAPGVFSLGYHLVGGAKTTTKPECKKLAILNEAVETANKKIGLALAVLDPKYSNPKWRKQLVPAAFGDMAYLRNMTEISDTFAKLQDFSIPIRGLCNKRPSYDLYWDKYHTKLEVSLAPNFFFESDDSYTRDSRANGLISFAVQDLLRTSQWISQRTGEDWYMVPAQELKGPNKGLVPGGHPRYPRARFRPPNAKWQLTPKEIDKNWRGIRDKVQDMANNPDAYWVFANLVTAGPTIKSEIMSKLELMGKKMKELLTTGKSGSNNGIDEENGICMTTLQQGTTGSSRGPRASGVQGGPHAAPDNATLEV